MSRFRNLTNPTVRFAIAEDFARRQMRARALCELDVPAEPDFFPEMQLFDDQEDSPIFYPQMLTTVNYPTPAGAGNVVGDREEVTDLQFSSQSSNFSRSGETAGSSLDQIRSSQTRRFTRIFDLNADARVAVYEVGTVCEPFIMDLLVNNGLSKFFLLDCFYRKVTGRGSLFAVSQGPFGPEIEGLAAHESSRPYDLAISVGPEFSGLGSNEKKDQVFSALQRESRAGVGEEKEDCDWQGGKHRLLSGLDLQNRREQISKDIDKLLKHKGQSRQTHGHKSIGPLHEDQEALRFLIEELPADRKAHLWQTVHRGHALLIHFYEKIEAFLKFLESHNNLHHENLVARRLAPHFLFSPVDAEVLQHLAKRSLKDDTGWNVFESYGLPVLTGKANLDGDNFDKTGDALYKSSTDAAARATLQYKSQVRGNRGQRDEYQYVYFPWKK
ncbi:unnamed protein product [Amoebophrya sp. A120]|nr:unnamed protein product [Amoebophrya sp. A120]|eukprot:GSA120T00012505001.1